MSVSLANQFIYATQREVEVDYRIPRASLADCRFSPNDLTIRVKGQPHSSLFLRLQFKVPADESFFFFDTYVSGVRPAQAVFVGVDITPCGVPASDAYHARHANKLGSRVMRGMLDKIACLLAPMGFRTLVIKSAIRRSGARYDQYRRQSDAAGMQGLVLNTLYCIEGERMRRIGRVGG